MLNRSTTLTAVLALSSLALAQQNSNQEVGKVSASPLATTACAATFTSGTGRNTTQFCVTANGNITQFSRGGDEYIQVEAVSEGYGICDEGTGTRYFDYALNDSGNLGSATFTSTASQAISTRITSDGAWQITNTITKIAASKSGPGAAKVSMKLKNLANTARGVLILRMADVDFSSGGAVDTHNDFDFTLDTAYGLEPGFRSGLSITNNSFLSNTDVTALALNNPVGPDPCEISSAPQPFTGDGAIGIFYLLTLRSGATKTFNMTYKPI